MPSPHDPRTDAAGPDPSSSPFAAVILASWARCRAAGFVPGPAPFRQVSPDELTRRLRRNAKLLSVARPHLEKALAVLPEGEHRLFLTDEDGIILAAVGEFHSPDVVALVPSVDWSEAAVGTNGAGTALAAGRPVAVIGTDHLDPRLHAFGCAAAPIHDSSAKVQGAIGLASPAATLLPQCIALPAYLAWVVERALVERVDARQLQLLLEGINDYGIILVDPTGIVLTWNSGAERLYGYTDAEVIGRSIDLFYLPEDRAAGRPAAELRASRETGREKAHAWRLRKNGTQFWAECVTAPISDAAGEIQAFSRVIRNVTQPKLRDECLRSMVDHALDAIITTDDGGVIRWCGGAVQKIFGHAPSDLTGRNVKTLMPDPWREEHDGYLREYLRTGRAGIMGSCREVVGHRRDGSVFPLELTLSEFRLGHHRFFTGVVRDISARKRAEGALRASEQRLRLAQKAAAIGTFEWNTRTDSTVWTAEMEAMHGLRPGAFAGTLAAWRELVHPDDWDGVAALARQALDSGLPTRGEWRVRWPDGSTHWIAGHFQMVNGPGAPTRLVGVNVDVTDRVLREQREREDAERLRLAVEAADIGLFDWNVQTHQVYFSPRWKAHLGYLPEEVADTWEAFETRLHPDDWGPVLARLRAYLDDPWPNYSSEFRLRHRDGSYRIIQSRATLLLDNQERPLRMIGTHFDVTDRKRAEETRQQLESQLRQSQKMDAFGQLAGGVAHDFNNILTVIGGFTDLILSQTAPNEPRRGLLEQIQRAGERAAALTRQLLAFSRQQVLEPVILNLNAVVRDTEIMLRRLIGEDIDLVTDLDSTVGLVRVVPGQIEQVILNLAVNARDAMPRGGRLIIRTCAVEAGGGEESEADRPGGMVRLEVEDTGCGIPPDVLARVFEPFFTTKGVGRGTGLGLAVVQGIIQQSGGTIEIESTVGTGSTFRITLPVIPATASVRPAAERAPPVPGTETILLVEDEDAVRDFSLLALRHYGYTVLTASTGSEALAVAAAYPGRVNLLVTDVVMPEMGGGELAEALLARYPGLKVLFLSGYTDDAVIRHGVSHAGVAFLHKPFTPPALARKVRDVLDG